MKAAPLPSADAEQMNFNDVDDLEYESDGERKDFQSLKEIFGSDRSEEIKRIFLSLRHSQPKENRFIEIANALIATVEEEDRKKAVCDDVNRLQETENGAVNLSFKINADLNMTSNQVSVKPKRQRSDEETNSNDATLNRRDTELFDVSPDEATKMKKPKMIVLKIPNQSQRIFDFLAKLNTDFPDAKFINPDVIYNRLDAVVDGFDEECRKITQEILQTLYNSAEVGQEEAAATAPPPLKRYTTSDETRAAIINVLINDLGEPINHDVEEISKQVKEMEELLGASCPPWESLFRRLAKAGNLATEKQRIFEEFNMAGPSNTNNPTATGSGDDFLMTEILPEAERSAMKNILEMFPDVDPHYVLKELAERRRKPDDLAEALSRRSYPKYKDRLEKQRKEERRRQFLDPKFFDRDEFLRTFGDDPEKYFMDTSRVVSELYRYHVVAQLQNDFPHVKQNVLDEQLKLHNNHYLPAFRGIQKILITGRDGRKKVSSVFHKRKIQMETVPYPDAIDELFFRELQFLRNYEEITDYLETKKGTRRQRIDDARIKNELKECLCCCIDEILPEEMILCSNESHAYCSDCVRRHAEEVISQSRVKVTCISDDCDGSFTYSSLQSLIKPPLMNLLLRRNQMAEIRQAGIENIASCPFCEFLLIMENDDDRVFSCRNPECLRESCRLCKEPNHVPLKCNEVEKADETSMRTFIENRMADALIRTCSKCGQRIVKEDGCNKLSCPCGACICYVCRKDISREGYDHFSQPFAGRGGNSQCALHTGLNKVHDDPVEEAGEAAKKEFLAAHPHLKGLRDVQLKTLMDKSPRQGGGPPYLRRAFEGGLYAHHYYFNRLNRPVRGPAQQRQIAYDSDSSDDDLPAHRPEMNFAPAYRQMIVPQYPMFGFFQMPPAIQNQYEHRPRPVFPPTIHNVQMPPRRREVLFGGRFGLPAPNNGEQQRRNVVHLRQPFVERMETFHTIEDLIVKEVEEEVPYDFDLIDFINEPVENKPIEFVNVREEAAAGNNEEGILADIEQLRIQVNDAQIQLCEKQRSAANGVGGPAEFSVRDLMLRRDELLTRLRTLEENALRSGVREDALYSNECVITNDDIEQSIEEARKLMEIRKDNEQRQAAASSQLFEDDTIFQARQFRNLHERRPRLNLADPHFGNHYQAVAADAVRIRGAMNQLVGRATLLESDESSFADLLNCCEYARRLALDFLPTRHVEMRMINEIIATINFSNWAEMKQRVSYVLRMILLALKDRLSFTLPPSPDRRQLVNPNVFVGRRQLKPPPVRLQNRNDDGATVAARMLNQAAAAICRQNRGAAESAVERMRSQADLTKTVDTWAKTVDNLNKHKNETQHLTRQLDEITNELTVVREQRRILEGREADLLAMQARLRASVGDRQREEEDLTRRIADLAQRQKQLQHCLANPIPLEKVDETYPLVNVNDVPPSAAERAGFAQILTRRLEQVRQQENRREEAIAQKQSQNDPAVSRGELQLNVTKLRQSAEKVFTKVRRSLLENKLQLPYAAIRINQISGQLRQIEKQAKKCAPNDDGKKLLLSSQLDRLRLQLDRFEAKINKLTSKNDVPLIDFDEDEGDDDANSLAVLYENVPAADAPLPMIDISDESMRQDNISGNFEQDTPGPSGWQPNEAAGAHQPAVKPKCPDFIQQYRSAKIFRKNSAGSSFSANTRIQPPIQPNRFSPPLYSTGFQQNAGGMLQINVHVNGGSAGDSFQPPYVNIFASNGPQPPVASVPPLPRGNDETNDELENIFK